MADLFISYAHQDHKAATEIARALANLNVSVWSDQAIRAGEEWMPAIERALDEAKVMVLCVSPSFLASDWAQLEIGVALSRSRSAGVRVIPVILSESVVPESLRRFQFIDARQLSVAQVATAIQKVVEASRNDT
jgi:hypothetical protein